MQMGMMLKLSSGKTTGKLCACIEKEFEILCVIDIVDTKESAFYIVNVKPFARKAHGNPYSYLAGTGCVLRRKSVLNS
jgi:hypothetical protein